MMTAQIKLMLIMLFIMGLESISALYIQAHLHEHWAMLPVLCGLILFIGVTAYGWAYLQRRMPK